MAKKIVGFIKLQVPAGKANPSPPIGPALGQRGLNIMEFCKAFNAQTQGVEPGLPLPVVITAFADKSFTFIIKTPPATVLIKKAIKLDKGSANPNKVTGFVGGAKNRPAPISEQDVQKIVDQMQEGTDKPRHKVEFVVGEYVRVKEGPFTDFNGTVEEVNYEKSKMRVSVTIFGRATPVELDFSQVEKA